MTRPVPTTSAPARSLARGNHPAGRALGVPADRRPLDRAGDVAGAPVLRLVRGDGRVGGREPRPGRVRLTRRGRTVLGGLVVAGGMGVAAFVGPSVLGGSASEPAITLAGGTSVVVRAGDTLWSIAVALDPEVDPRATVDALQEVNRLESAELVPGQVLVVP